MGIIDGISNRPLPSQIVLHMLQNELIFPIYLLLIVIDQLLKEQKDERVLEQRCHGEGCGRDQGRAFRQGLANRPGDHLLLHGRRPVSLVVFRPQVGRL